MCHFSVLSSRAALERMAEISHVPINFSRVYMTATWQLCLDACMSLVIDVHICMCDLKSKHASFVLMILACEHSFENVLAK